jgi:hypothetical protein
MKVWSRVLSIGGAIAVLVSIWSGNLPGLFGVGVIAILASLVIWIIGKRSQV